VIDITPLIKEHMTAFFQPGMQEGWVTILSRHTTTAVTINENEPRLVDDLRQASWAACMPS
jgi:thiamine phosphate synthase YjbQ (UPF0047 family)